MTSPRAVIDAVDRLVEALDEATLPELPTNGRSTASFADICAEWDRFAARVNALGTAIAHPFDRGSTLELLRADRLVDDDVYRLSHRLRRVGEALAQRSV